MRNQSGYASYSNALKTEVGKNADAAVLEKCALRLRNLRSNVNSDQWKEILNYNLKVWTVIQAELCNPENTLPVEIKSNLLNLSNFVDKRTFEILWLGDNERDPKSLDVLINININIAQGLRGNP